MPNSLLHTTRILLNHKCCVGGTWPGGPDETSVYPQMMYVDYVPVYQHPGQSSSLIDLILKLAIHPSLFVFE